jgi:3,4-dihydroxy 2-butanone 4-phosphate synthase/GTP cyclohydrolase II
MARVPDLIPFARTHELKIITIKDLIEYRMKTEKFVLRKAEFLLPTKNGEFKAIAYSSQIDNETHIAMIKGQWAEDEPILVRVHSSCLTGDAFGSLRCDCGEQLHQAMAMVNEAGKGVVLYMNQEGRGIGILHKLIAYQLQDNGKDTVEANEALGFKADLREYGLGAQILADLGIRKIRLLTNNPKKIVGLEGYGLEVVERVSIQVPPSNTNIEYLKTKKEKLGHLLNL